KAYNADPTSIFGGIVVFNRKIDERTAKGINKIFVEIVAAPSYSEKALTKLKSKKNIRLLQIENITESLDENSYDIKKVAGGILVQTIDSKLFPEEFEINCVTVKEPTEMEKNDLLM